MPRLVSRAALLAGVFLASACTLPLEPRQRPVEAPHLADAVSLPLGRSGTSPLDAPAVTELRIPASALRVRASDAGEPLPRRVVGPMTLGGVDPVSALSLLAREAGVSVAADEEAARRVVRMDLAGRVPLQRAVDAIASNAGLFWSHHGGVVQLRGKQRFVVDIPPVEGMAEEVVESLRALGAESVSAARQTSTVSFVGDRTVAEAAQVYLDRVARSANLIIYDTYILEVQLRDENQLGVRWDRLRANLPNNGAITLTGPALGAAAASGGSAFALGLAPNIGSVGIDIVLGFLATEGSVRSIARPTITTVSGTEGRFFVGGETRYVERTNSSAAAGFLTSGPQPATLRTGIELVVRGSETDGTVVSTIDLKMVQLIRFNTFTTGSNTVTNASDQTGTADADSGGTRSTLNQAAGLLGLRGLFGGGSNPGLGQQTLRLPETSNREIRDTARARPGDLIVLAGMLQSNDEVERQRLLGVPSNNLRNERRQEIVTILRPRLVRFVRER